MAQKYLDDYPRADDHLPDGDLIGPREMAQLTNRTIRAVYKWFEREDLCPADGPMVDGRPTWRRQTFLAWAYRQGRTREVRPGYQAFDAPPGEPLAIHEEAERCAAEVPEEVTWPVRDYGAPTRKEQAAAKRAAEGAKRLRSLIEGPPAG